MQLVEIVGEMGFGEKRAKRIMRRVDKLLDDKKNANPLLIRLKDRGERFGAVQVLYRFGSSMARDAVYGTMVSKQRSVIHAKIAKWLKTKEALNKLEGAKFSS